jgi:hypothetical protein
MDQPGGEGAHETLAAGEILLRNPAVERARVWKILLDLGHQNILIEVGNGMFRRILHNAARENMRRCHAVETFLHIGIVRGQHLLPGLDQKIDNLSKRHVKQRRDFRARMHDFVQVDPGCRKGNAQIARLMRRVTAFDDHAACKNRCRDHVVRLHIG